MDKNDGFSSFHKNYFNQNSRKRHLKCIPENGLEMVFGGYKKRMQNNILPCIQLIKLKNISMMYQPRNTMALVIIKYNDVYSFW